MAVRQVDLRASVDVREFMEQLQIKVHLNRTIYFDLCMAFLLLKENLVDDIGLRFDNFFILLRKTMHNHSKYEAVDFNRRSFKGCISIHGIDYALHYILKFYRDGIAESEHIDIDFLNDAGKELTLTIACGEYQEYSEDEILRMLE